jgi:hypothetical protein
MARGLPAVGAFLIISTVCGAADSGTKFPWGAVALPGILLRGPALAVIGAVTVTPSTISFFSPDPDITPAGGSSEATISWRMDGGARPWTLTVAAASSSFMSCSAVPLSAVRFSCQSAARGGGLANASCASGTFTLTTLPQTIASGTRQGSGSSPFTIRVAFTFTDAWNYPANSSCSLNLTYTASGN